MCNLQATWSQSARNHQRFSKQTQILDGCLSLYNSTHPWKCCANTSAPLPLWGATIPTLSHETHHQITSPPNLALDSQRTATVPGLSSHHRWLDLGCTSGPIIITVPSRERIHIPPGKKGKLIDSKGPFWGDMFVFWRLIICNQHLINAKFCG